MITDLHSLLRHLLTSLCTYANVSPGTLTKKPFLSLILVHERRKERIKCNFHYEVVEAYNTSHVSDTLTRVEALPSAHNGNCFLWHHSLCM